MVHMSDIAWGVSGEDALNLHHKGETVQAVVLDVDVEKERISLGIKQLERGGHAAGGRAPARAQDEGGPRTELQDGRSPGGGRVGKYGCKTGDGGELTTKTKKHKTK